MTRRPISAIWLVLAGIASVQFGAALAKHLFDRIEPTAMVWLRLVTSAVVLVAIARPALRGRSRDDWLTMVAFGVSLGTMNWAIYQSFARIPLGLAVTIEFAGPLRARGRDVAARPRPGVGRPRGPRRRAARLRADRPRPGRRRLRTPRGRVLGGVHPAERADRTPLGRPRRTGDGERGRLRAAGAAGHPGRRLRPARPADPAAGRGGRPAELGDPVRRRPDGAAHHQARACSAS